MFLRVSRFHTFFDNCPNCFCPPPLPPPNNKGVSREPLFCYYYYYYYFAPPPPILWGGEESDANCLHLHSFSLAAPQKLLKRFLYIFFGGNLLLMKHKNEGDNFAKKWAELKLGN